MDVISKQTQQKQNKQLGLHQTKKALHEKKKKQK